MENTVTGVETVVNSITTQLSAANLWGAVNSIVPVLAVSVLFGLSFYLLKRIINKTKRAKGGM